MNQAQRDMLKNETQRQILQEHAASLAASVAESLPTVKPGTQEAKDTAKLATDVAEIARGLAEPL